MGLIFSSSIENNKSYDKSIETKFKQLPHEVLSEIVNYIICPNKIITIPNLKEQGKQLLNIYLIMKLSSNINIMKQQYELLTKYPSYNNDYEWYSKLKSKDNKPTIGNPILLDILFSGCKLHYAYSSNEYYTDNMKDDIKLCIKLFPEAINSTFGNLRCRNNITPLYAACTNGFIPTNIIEYLIQQGANIKHYILVNGEPVSILDDLNYNYNCNNIHNIHNINKLEQLFKKYSK